MAGGRGSGDGGIGGYGGGGPPSGDTSSCDKIRLQVSISSPVADVIGTLREGDFVEILKPNNAIEVVVRSTRLLAGYLVANALLDQLENCLDEGVAFQGEVMTVKGAMVMIQITARQ